MNSNTKPRAVLYLRQSVAREESISIELQEEAGRQYCASMGYDIVAVKADEGISGRTWHKRPAVQHVLSMIEEQQAEVIVLWKWSRLSRARLDWAVAIYKVESAGGRIESATEPVDVSTSSGRFARGVLAEMAAFESERIGDIWKEAQQRLISVGLPHSGRKRFGYDYADKRFTINEGEAAAVAEAYRRYLAGASFSAIADYLNSTGHVLTGEAKNVGHWYTNSVISLLDNPFSSGQITYHGEFLPGAHDAIIEPEIWEAYTVMRKNTRGTRRPRELKHPYAGLVFCGTCGSPAYFHTHTASGKHTFDCKGNQTAGQGYNPNGRHQGGAIVAKLIDAEVATTIKALAAEIIQAAKNAPAKPPTAAPSPEPGIRRALVKAGARLDSLTDKFVDEIIPREVYERKRDEIQEEIGKLEFRLKELRVKAQSKPRKVDTKMMLKWDRLSLAEQRSLLEPLVGRIEFWSGRPAGRVRVWTHWELEEQRLVELSER